MLHKRALQSLAPRTASALTICNLHVEEEKKQLRLSRDVYNPVLPQDGPLGSYAGQVHTANHIFITHQLFSAPWLLFVCAASR